MKTMRLIPVVAACMALAVCGHADELVENGDFKDDLNYWQLHRHGGYVPEPTTRLANGELSFSGLSFLTKYYLSLSQAVEIKKGVNYKLSYEIKGPAKQNYVIRIGDPGSTADDIKPTLHYLGTKLTVSAEWQTVEQEFVGKFDTDRNWYRKVNKARKYNTLDKKGVARTPRLADKIKVDPEDRPCTTFLSFYLGSLEGRFAIRNISITEVE